MLRLVVVLMCLLLSGCLSHSANLHLSRADSAITSTEIAAVREAVAAVLVKRGFVKVVADAFSRRKTYWPDLVDEWILTENLGALRGSRVISAMMFAGDSSIRIAVGARDDGDKAGVEEVKHLLLHELRATFPDLRIMDESFAYFNLASHKEPNQTPEPTPLLVTIRADARLAPSSVVAHL
jgi:hypothetical protein